MGIQSRIRTKWGNLRVLNSISLNEFIKLAVLQSDRIPSSSLQSSKYLILISKRKLAEGQGTYSRKAGCPTQTIS
jgi:hypothetical protein